jgi:hypothetical protein
LTRRHAVALAFFGVNFTLPWKHASRLATIQKLPYYSREAAGTGNVMGIVLAPIIGNIFLRRSMLVTIFCLWRTSVFGVEWVVLVVGCVNHDVKNDDND